MEFNEKRILITGGSSGIGKAAAKAFLKNGAVVCISGRNADKLKKTVNELKQISDRLYGIPADVSAACECEKLVAEAASKLGGIDVLVNSAGIWLEGPADEVTEQEWDTVVDTNLKGSFFMCRYAIPLLAENSGCIVNLSSDSGLVGNDLASVYCASKGGITLLTKSLAVELARQNIRVNAVCPGDVSTPMLDKAVADCCGTGSDELPETYLSSLLEHYPERPGRRFTRPEEVAQCILFLASDRIEAVTGACLSIDFGLTAGY